jgi:zinc protease
MPQDVMMTVLPNGLTVHLKEIHTAPIVSQWLWYRVGSRNEVPGLTGISHWVEHMQFKGTPLFPANILDKAISREGGYWNAMTYLDWTAYYETLPADKIDLGLRLEADRMVNSIYDAREVDSERTVIISERESSENEPLFHLGEAVQTAAFDRHAYRNEVIGSKEDLHHIQRDDLYAHYRRHYTPNNALLAIAGDFDTNSMLTRLNELYGDIPAGESLDQKVEQEAPARGERRRVVEGPGQTTYVQLAYHSPAASSADFFALTVVDSLLTGPTSLNMFGGGGISNKTSRLYRTLVERELAVSVNGGLQATIDPYLYDITMITHPDCTPEKALAALDGEVQRLQEELISTDEIARAMKQARALFAYGSENITNQAFWLGHADMYATYDWFVNYVQELDKISPADVQRAAQTYLSPDNRVVGIYLPNGEEEMEGEEVEE